MKFLRKILHGVKFIIACIGMILCLMLVFAVFSIPLLQYTGKENNEIMPAGISKIELKTQDNSVVLDVHLDGKESITCKKAIDILDLESIVIDDRVYSPMCTRVNDNLLRIRFKERVLI